MIAHYGHNYRHDCALDSRNHPGGENPGGRKPGSLPNDNLQRLRPCQAPYDNIA